MPGFCDKLLRKIDAVDEHICSSPADKVNRIFIAVSAVILLLSIVYIEVERGWSDVLHYYVNISELVDGRQMPYRDYPFEYPPLALLFMLVPKIFSVSEETFCYSYLFFAFAFFLIGAHFISKITNEMGSPRNRTLVLYMLMFVFANVFVVFRYDIFAAVLVIISLWCYKKEKYGLAFAIMAAGAMTKLYPALFLLPMLVPFLYRKQWMYIAKYTLISVAVCLLAEVPFLISDPGTAFAYMQYHSDRGLQVESVFAGFIILFNMISPGDITAVDGYGSRNILGWLPDLLAAHLTEIAALSILLLMAVFLIRMKRNGLRADDFTVVSTLCFALLMTFILFSKVYSLQYIIWIMSLFPLVMLDSVDKKIRTEMLIIFILFAIFSTANGLALYFDLSDLNIRGTVNICLRNIMHILLTVEAVRLAMRFTAPKPTGK